MDLSGEGNFHLILQDEYGRLLNWHYMRTLPDILMWLHPLLTQISHVQVSGYLADTLDMPKCSWIIEWTLLRNITV